MIGSLRVDLHLPAAGSLKEKRRELRRIKAWITKANLAVSEIDHHDRWQRAGLLLSVAAGGAGEAQQRLEEASRRLHTDPVAVVVGEARDLHAAPVLEGASLSHLADG